MTGGRSQPPETLYGYYREQSLLPTHAAFSTEEELAAYNSMRANFLETKLMLPPRAFANARVLEFGPDSGENSLGFATWGARLTLAEPNERAVTKIREYFRHFQLEDRIESISYDDVLTFKSDHRFDIVDAEGFIYTVALKAWLESFARLVAPHGHFIISYYERYGGFFELLLKALHACAMVIREAPADDVAEKLYRTKWDTIPHTRRFSSWVMDVLCNPFIAMKYFIPAKDLCEQATAHGFRLYSSWPTLRDPLAFYWHKKRLSGPEDAARNAEHITRSTLSFMSGTRLYLAGSPAEASQLTARADVLLERVADLALGNCAVASNTAEDARGLADAVGNVAVIEDAGARAAFARLLRAIAACCDHISAGDVDGLAKITSSDSDFLAMWGMPANFAVFERITAE